MLNGTDQIYDIVKETLCNGLLVQFGVFASLLMKNYRAKQLLKTLTETL